LKYLSVCSGIEAASVAWHPLGWQPVAFSEIEPFPSAVLAHHYPNVPNLGDMTKFQEWPDEPVELLVGGTPCQSFSVAGLRKGLEDPRGNLMLTYLAIAQRYRPRWVVWENVPGVLSSGGGRDFGTFLGALGELGYGWAYRVLDAQWFGVAQRRRRVFVVGHLGDWQRAAQVLFERESVSRNFTPRREAREAVAGGVGGSVANGSAGVTPHIFKVRGGVEREDGSRGSTNIGKQAGKGYLGSEERAFTLAAAQDQFVAQPITQFGNIAGSLTARHDSSPCADRGQNVVAQPIPIHDQATRHAGKRGEHSDGKGNGLGIGQPGDPAPTLTKGDKHAVAQPVAMRESGQGYWMQDSISDTMRSDSNRSGKEGTVVAQPVAFNSYQRTEAQVTWPLGASDGRKVEVGVRHAMQVRRLTPVECERLQGFPDGFTNIPWRKKPEAPDGPRYKALGNSMAVPCMAWIGKRIAEVDRGD
jgi:DNA (cytosine-5)-methyltransferase 1